MEGSQKPEAREAGSKVVEFNSGFWLLASGFPGPSRGFTLIEVMVALTIMSIVLTIAFSGLSVGLDSWERGTREIEDLNRRAAVERLLKRQLGVAAVEVRLDNQRFSLFRGSISRMEFISEYSLIDGVGDFRIVQYMIENGRFLYSERHLFGSRPGQGSDAPASEELATFQEVAFRYLARNNENVSSWSAEWTAEKELPVGVEIRMDGDVFVVPMVNR